MKGQIQLAAAGIFLLLASTSFAQTPAPFPPIFQLKPQNPYLAPQMYSAPFSPTTPTQNPQYQQNSQYIQNPQMRMAPQGYYQRQVQAPQNAKPAKPFREFSGYLGLGLDILSPSVRAQLPSGINQGILVKEFAKDSPALNTDLKAFDVIYGYGKIAINHPAQFIKIVRNDQPGRSVNLKVVRKGQLLNVPVSLGSQKTPNPKEFNGLAIKQLGKNTYEALIRFVGANGNKQMRSYKGTREEIYQQAYNAQDLPHEERQQILYATRPRQGGSNNSGFGSFFPFGGKNESGKDWMNPSRFFKW